MMLVIRAKSNCSHQRRIFDSVSPVLTQLVLTDFAVCRRLTMLDDFIYPVFAIENFTTNHFLWYAQHSG